MVREGGEEGEDLGRRLAELTRKKKLSAKTAYGVSQRGQGNSCVLRKGPERMISLGGGVEVGY